MHVLEIKCSNLAVADDLALESFSSLLRICYHNTVMFSDLAKFCASRFITLKCLNKSLLSFALVFPLVFHFHILVKWLLNSFLLMNYLSV